MGRFGRIDESQQSGQALVKRLAEVIREQAVEQGPEQLDAFPCQGRILAGQLGGGDAQTVTDANRAGVAWVVEHGRQGCAVPISARMGQRVSLDRVDGKPDTEGQNTRVCIHVPVTCR